MCILTGGAQVLSHKLSTCIHSWSLAGILDWSVLSTHVLSMHVLSTHVLSTHVCSME